MYHGYYINLERDSNRRSMVESSLQQEGLEHLYIRVNAIDGAVFKERMATDLTSGEVGCWMSHLGILRDSCNSDKHVHIFEDDTFVSRHVPTIFETFVSAESKWDLFFTDFFILPNIHVFKVFHEFVEDYRTNGAIHSTNISKLGFCCTSSYFVNRSSIGKVCELISDCPERNLPIDLMYRQLANEGKLSVYATVPFFSIQFEDSCMASSIRKVNNTDELYYLFRKSFYFNTDLDQIYLQMNSMQNCACSRFAKIYGKTMEILCDDSYELR